MDNFFFVFIDLDFNVLDCPSLIQYWSNWFVKAMSSKCYNQVAYEVNDTNNSLKQHERAFS